jgi:hypothetical protein
VRGEEEREERGGSDVWGRCAREREEGESRLAAGPSAASWVAGGKGEGSGRWAAVERGRPKREEGEVELQEGRDGLPG